MNKDLEFKFKTELQQKDDNGDMALTRRLSIWQKLTTSLLDNVHIEKMTISYTSRAGQLAKGLIRLRIIDNRIVNDEMYDESSEENGNILYEVVFDVGQDMVVTWAHDISLCASDVLGNVESPIILRTKIMDCNFKPGFSLGLLRVKVSVSTSEMIHRVKRRSSTGAATVLPAVRGPEMCDLRAAEKPYASCSGSSGNITTQSSVANTRGLMELRRSVSHRTPRSAMLL
ncbi:TPA_asm: P3 [Nymphaea alba virus 1]|uniref:P3 n=1 Tax=Nymphaea alba virus 1 TaxID=2793733 RepID=A0A8D9PGS7_9RHAB|nr:P3 [Nymphaea alba virus 1]DAF42341.1 TPA_asm: P3 [Nymphaea alba virus 1]